MKIVAIGDIHGQYQKLVWLMQKLERKSIDFENDLIIQLGDLVDGGPDTKRVVSTLFVNETIILRIGLFSREITKI